MTTDYIQLHAYEPFTTVEGPGHRICIWVQGCSIQCHNCFNPETWSMDGGETVSVEKLFQQMKQAMRDHPSIEGVTFLGGEPFLQAKPLATLGHMLQKEGMSIVVFTGFPYKHIVRAKRADWEALLDVTDLLMDGPYIDSLHDLNRPWVGSMNQQYRFLTSRYRHIQEEIMKIDNKIEVHLRPDGTVHVNGIAQDLTLQELEKVLADS